jgi:restriction system protein
MQGEYTGLIALLGFVIAALVFFLFVQIMNHFWVLKNKTKDSDEKQITGVLLEKNKDVIVGTLIERNKDIIEKFLKNHNPHEYGFMGHYMDDQVLSCLKEIIEREGVWGISPNKGERLYLWERRVKLPSEYLTLKSEIRERLTKKRDDLLDGEKRQKIVKFQNKLKDYKELIDKFLEIAERKVSLIDDYGDEDWDALSKEIETFLIKVAKKEGGVEEKKVREFMSGKHSSFWLGGENGEFIVWLKKELETIFREYHSRQKGNKTNVSNFNSLSGQEFETYIADLIKKKGFNDVRGTPATGDQGADLIAKIMGKTIIIQAKRYEKPVGNKAVQEVISAVQYYKGDEGWVITNSSFTPSAKALAQKGNIRLIDGHDLKNFRI